ncbi:MAG: hypothetical protein AAFP02_05965, partial [Bacteroidota bacterium]
MEPRYAKDKNDFKLLGRGPFSPALAVFVILSLCGMLFAIFGAEPVRWNSVVWTDPLSWWQLALGVILTIVIIFLARVFFPLRWNAKNGLAFQPLRLVPSHLLAMFVWGLIGIYGLWAAFSIEELGIRIGGGLFGLGGSYAALHFGYQAIKRVWQYAHFGNSYLEIRPGVPRRGDTLQLRLKEHKLNRYSEEVSLLFRHIHEEMITEGKGKRRSSRMARKIMHEERIETSVSLLTKEGVSLQIPLDGVVPTDYQRLYPKYWEIEIDKPDSRHPA